MGPTRFSIIPLFIREDRRLVPSCQRVCGSPLKSLTSGQTAFVFSDFLLWIISTWRPWGFRSDHVLIYSPVPKLWSEQIFNKYKIFVKVILLYTRPVKQDGECIKDYETEEEDRAPPRAVEPSRKFFVELIKSTSCKPDNTGLFE